jgi:aryl-alcohol dehydrogenase-like predicted oxidoreductase
LKLALGTAQFGLSYGVANKAGKVSIDEAAAILQTAWDAGVDTLDTAIAYGNSEGQLGKIGVENWQVISKLPSLAENCTDIKGWVRASVEGSLKRLRISQLRGLLLHRPRELLGPQGDVLYRALIDLKEQGLVEKVGVSICDGPEDLDAIWTHFPIDLMQSPFNVVDRRLATSGWLERLHQKNVEVHTRSIFLQGLLLMAAGSRPAFFSRWQQAWDQWHCWLDDQRLVPLQVCLNFVLSRPEIDHVVIGIDSRKQLQQVLAYIDESIPMPPMELMSEDQELINPAYWKVS